MIDFIFVRHGQSQANANKEIATDDSPLTAQGIEQAKITAREVKDLGVVQIASSPLIRAQQTAEIIAGELGIDLSHVKVLEELKERDLGDLKGKPKDHESDYYYSVDNELKVESRLDTLKRMTQCIKKIRELGAGGKVLVTGHAVSGYFLIEAAKGKTQLDELESPSEISNADYLVITVN